MKRAYTNGILLDGTEQMEPVRGKVLLTENDKITAIADASVSLDGYEVIDLHGGYLCPGLINLHVHLAGNGKPSAKPRDNAALVRKILSNRLTRAIAYRLVCSYAKLELLGGVTTVRTVGGIYQEGHIFFAAKGGNGWYICTEAVIIGAGHDKRLGLGMRREGLCGLLAGKRLRQALRCLVTGNKAYAVMCQKSGMNGTDMAIGSKKNQIIFPGTGQDKRIIPHGRAAGAKPGLPCPISLCQKGLSFP